MKTLGARVRQFRDHPSRQWSAARMAREVGTTRQSIENLEMGSVGTPRYLAKLAAVMGTTVDDLLGIPAQVRALAACEPPSPPFHVNAPAPTAAGLLGLLHGLGRHIAQAPTDRRPAIAANLRQWALDGGPDHYVPVLASLLSAHDGKQQAAR
jgi:DNA-binding XRE family transcriptional regulator